MDILHFAASGVCHQAPERTLTAAGHLSPLCARCMGMYLGVLCSLVCLAATRRLRAEGFPHRSVLIVLLAPIALNFADVAFYIIRGVDAGGNAQRLVFGSLLGAAAALLVNPACARLLSVKTNMEAPVRSMWEAVGAMGLSAIVSAAAGLQGGTVTSAAGVASVVGFLLALTIANLAALTALLKISGRNWWLTPSAILLAMIQAGCAGAVRHWVLVV
ncbi:MAG: DUF2085 domain-containing protein [Armatimonadota bacterium]|nr:DUF2085 domain-containing protein [Armatimonadota bacterium]